MAILLGEQDAEAVMQAIDGAQGLCISAGTLAEALIVADRRGIAPEMQQLIKGLGIEIVSLTPSGANAVALAYRTWGKGIHAAGLNFGGCFAYALAAERNCPLLFVGDDFSKTDVRAAILPLA